MTAATLGQLGLIAVAAWLILAIVWPADRKPRAQPTLSLGEDHSLVPPRLVPVLRVMFWISAGIIALLIAAIVAAGCPPSRPPVPDVRPTLAELDRAHRLVWMHPLTVATWRAAQ